MPEQKRQTSVMWQGDLDHGQGVIVESTSGVLKNISFTRLSRVEQADNQASPEELLAGAHAQCYIMGLAHVLMNMGILTERLLVVAQCVLEMTKRGPQITRMTLRVSACIPQLDQATFEQVARKAEALCPVSRVLRDGLEIFLEARLES